MEFTQAEITAAAQTLLTDDKRTSVDGTTVDSHSLRERIEAIKFAQSCFVANSDISGLDIRVIRTGGMLQ